LLKPLLGSVPRCLGLLWHRGIGDGSCRLLSVVRNPTTRQLFKFLGVFHIETL
jgi:hypothetical protein